MNGIMSRRPQGNIFLYSACDKRRNARRNTTQCLAQCLLTLLLSIMSLNQCLELVGNIVDRYLNIVTFCPNSISISFQLSNTIPMPSQLHFATLYVSITETTMYTSHIQDILTWIHVTLSYDTCIQCVCYTTSAVMI
jgi:hypothetical protein